MATIRKCKSTKMLDPLKKAVQKCVHCRQFCVLGNAANCAPLKIPQNDAILASEYEICVYFHHFGPSTGLKLLHE